MITWLVFLKGAKEEFVLPVRAPRREDALKAAASAYPARDYQVLTSYGEEELRQILHETQAWQGEMEASEQETTARQPVVTELPATALAVVRKPSLQKKRVVPAAVPAPVAAAPLAPPLPVQETVRALPVETPHEAQPMPQDLPQDLKTMLALLKASAAATPATGAPVPLAGRVEAITGSPLPATALGMVPSAPTPTASPVVSRRPAGSLSNVPAPPTQSMAEVLKSLRK